MRIDFISGMSGTNSGFIGWKISEKLFEVCEIIHGITLSCI